MTPNQVQSILYVNDCGPAEPARRISIVKLVRRNASGLFPNRNLGQRITHQYRNAPKAITVRVTPSRRGSWLDFITTSTTGLTARTNRRYSGIKVIRASGSINVSTEIRSGRKKRKPNPHAASKQLCQARSEQKNDCWIGFDPRNESELSQIVCCPSERTRFGDRNRRIHL